MRDMLYNFAKFTAGFLAIVAVSLSVVAITGGLAGSGEASVLSAVKGFFTK